MAAQLKMQARFSKSLGDANSYPKNLLRSRKREYALNAYHDRLCSDEELHFHDKDGTIFIWDLWDGQTDFDPLAKITTKDQLDGHINKLSTSPRCRFIFIQTRTARGPLTCSRAQLLFILSFHQVMPSFLDFVFEFKHRENSITTTSFRQEDYIGQNDIAFEMKVLGRSGILIQHAFNLLAIEHETNPRNPNEYPWPRRHTTVYHSFDPKDNRSVWIIVKGNKLIRERLTKADARNLQHPGSASSVEASFSATLETLLIFFEWCLDNWIPYTEFLESRSRKTSANVKHVPVSDAVGEIQIKRALTKRSTMDTMSQSRTGTAISGTSPAPPKSPGRARRTLSRLTSRHSVESHELQAMIHPNMIDAENQTEKTIEMRNVDIEKTFNFNEIQRHRKLADEVDVAIMVIDQNKRVLEDVVDYYREMTESQDFRSYVTIDQCRPDVLNFFQRLRSVGRDLDNHQRRLRTLLKMLEKDEVLFNAILQYKSMHTGEYFAGTAQDSADKMEQWTVKMHDIALKTEQETVSMHVITIFTLVFLPGTFVATFFSSGVVSFDVNDGGANLGDWVVRWPALKLFLILCIPLMFATLSIWLVSYYFLAWRKSQKHAVSEAVSDVEKPPVGLGIQ